MAGNASLTMRRKLSSWLTPFRNALPIPHPKHVTSASGGNIGLAGLPNLRTADGLPMLARQEIDGAKKKIRAEVLSAKNPEVLVRALDDVSNNLCVVADAAELIRCLHPCSSMAAAATEAVDIVSELIAHLNVDPQIYRCLKEGENHVDFHRMTYEEQRVLHSFVAAMEQHGVHASESRRRLMLELQRKESALGQQLTQNTVDVNSRPLEILSEYVRTRQRLADARGFENWAEYALRENILSTRCDVNAFLASLLYRASHEIAGELDHVARLQGDALRAGASQGDAEELGTTIRRLKADAMSEWPSPTSRSFLTMESLLGAVETMLSDVFGIGMQRTASHPCELWHPTVEKFAVIDEDVALLENPQSLFVDAIDRPGKFLSAAQFTLRCRRLQGATRQTSQSAATAVAMRLSPRRGGARVSWEEARTFLHEMGHVCHALMSRTSLQHLSGTRGPIDYVELPSHLFEHFMSDPMFISTLIGRSMPELAIIRSIDRLCGVSHSFGVFDIAQQAFLALVDQAVYCWRGEGDLMRHIKDYLGSFDGLTRPIRSLELQGRTYPPLIDLLQIPRLDKFDHLVHYGASYYAYPHSKVVAAALWNTEGWNTATRDARASAGRHLKSAFFHQGCVAPATLTTFLPQSSGHGCFDTDNIIDAFFDFIHTRGAGR